METRATRSQSSAEFEWVDDSLLVVARPAARPGERLRLAVFDLDETLITTRSRRPHATSTDDWRFLCDEVPLMLNRFNREGFLLVVVTNQLGISKGIMSAAAFAQKASKIREALGVPVTFLAATRRDEFRKPCTAAFSTFVRQMLGSSDEMIDRKASFFCGDAAGRMRKVGGHDHSSCDLLFALNAHLPFIVPETMFNFNARTSAIPKSLNSLMPHRQFEKEYLKVLPNKSRVLALILGPPRSGKSVLASQLKGFVVCELKENSPKTAISRIVKELERPQFRVAVELGSPRREPREQILRAAREAEHRLCFFMALEPDFLRELNYYANYDSKPSKENAVDFEAASRRFSCPKHDEGFDQIVRVERLAPCFGHSSD